MPTTDPKLTRHPLSALFPDLPRKRREELVEDVREHGVREPIVLLDGQVLDGWHRYRAGIAAGVPVPTLPFRGGDPRKFVWSANAVRRDLGKKERMKVRLQVFGYRLPGRPKGRPKKKEKSAQNVHISGSGSGAPPSLPPTIREHAAAEHVSVGTVRRAQRELTQPEPAPGPAPQPTPPKPKRSGAGGVREQMARLLTERDDARSEVERLRLRVEELEEQVEQYREAAEPGGGETELRTLRAQLHEMDAERDTCRRQLAACRRRVKALEAGASGP